MSYAPGFQGHEADGEGVGESRRPWNPGSRLLGDARRLYGRIQKFIEMGVLPDSIDPVPLELACLALQLPLRTMKLLPTGKLGRTNVRDRAEQAAELLVTIGDQIDEALLEHTTQLLHEFSQKRRRTRKPACWPTR